MTRDERNKIITDLGLTIDALGIPDKLFYKGFPIGYTYFCWDGTCSIELFTKRESIGVIECRYYHERVDTVEDFWIVFNDKTLPEFKKAYKLQQLERIREDCD